MSLAEQRDAVHFLALCSISVVRACALVQINRYSFLYQPRERPADGIAAELLTLAQRHPRYGYRRAWALLRRKYVINRKRVHRLWKHARLQVKRIVRRRPKRERRLVLLAAYPNHIWAYDFLEDTDVHGQTFAILTVMDEFTREGLAIAAEGTTSAAWVIQVLEELVARHGMPAMIRSDNGAEFVAHALQAWLARHGIIALLTDLGSPWQNGKEERFNGTVRDECLNMYVFTSVQEADIRLETFRNHYNTERPHSRLAYQTPLEFKRDWNAANNQLDSLIAT